MEVMRAAGMDVLQAMRILMPPAWQAIDDLDPDVRAFYEFFNCQMEPWDGPAGIVLTDGRYAACCLDRNGLRPARYVITEDRHITIASEIGVYDYDEKDVVSKGRLGPGEMIAVDLVNGTLLDNDDIHDGTELGVAAPEGVHTDLSNYVPDGDSGASTSDPLVADRETQRESKLSQRRSLYPGIVRARSRSWAPHQVELR